MHDDVMSNIQHDIQEARYEAEFYNKIISKNQDYLNGYEIGNPLSGKFEKAKSRIKKEKYNIKSIDLHNIEKPKKTIMDKFNENKNFNVRILTSLLNLTHQILTLKKLTIFGEIEVFLQKTKRVCTVECVSENAKVFFINLQVCIQALIIKF